ncbi:hypothetical protein Cyrtocomes_01076 [Candidatus Cyrtobacter comes]|uniref:Uncharacterized protein n=1 Tax=Candidatus Cyrtobacter comes TaxID=675776 RepID=A0ABU5LA14_9RICK|nr:hypothetical protein [Candidatus Cyrtobacter comes]MDZ5762684.1 hypothetical protein [Candidatus Cyrtobacter comes]
MINKSNLYTLLLSASCIGVLGAGNAFASGINWHWLTKRDNVEFINSIEWRSLNGTNYIYKRSYSPKWFFFGNTKEGSLDIGKKYNYACSNVKGQEKLKQCLNTEIDNLEEMFEIRHC